MIHIFPLQTKRFIFIVELNSGYLSIRDRISGSLYKCRPAKINQNTEAWFSECFRDLPNPFEEERDKLDFIEWSVSHAYFGIEDSPINWELVQDLAH